MSKQNSKNLRNVALVAGAALATTGVTAMATTNVHADTTASPATSQTTDNAAQAVVKQAGQTNQDQETALKQKNANDQAQIDSIQQSAANVKAEHAQEITSASDQAQADYQSQAATINQTYDQKVADQKTANSQAEADKSQANADALAKAQAEQKQAEVNSAAVIKQANADYSTATSQAKTAQDSAVSQANADFDVAKSAATTAQTNANSAAQAIYDQAVKAATTMRSTAKSQAKTTYDNNVAKENASYDASKTNASTAHDTAVNEAKQTVDTDTDDVNAKKNAYDQAVKDNTKTVHGQGVKVPDSWNDPTMSTDGDKNYDNAVYDINQLPLTYRDWVPNYKSDLDKSEAVDPNTGLTNEQIAKINEYAITLINSYLTQHGLKPVQGSVEVQNILNNASKYSPKGDQINRQQLDDDLVNATKGSKYEEGLQILMTEGTSGDLMSPVRNGFGTAHTLLDYLVELPEILPFQDIANMVRKYQVDYNKPIAINLFYPTRGLTDIHSVDYSPTIVFSNGDYMDSDYNYHTDIGTPMPNTGFIDSIRAAQAGTTTTVPDDAPAVKRAKQALDDANAKLTKDTKAYNDLLAVKDPMTALNQAHQNKLNDLKTTYDNAVKAADDTYNDTVAKAQSNLNAAKSSSQKTYDETIKTAQAKHDKAVADAQTAYDNAVKSATQVRDEKIKQAKGDPSYLTDMKTRLTNELNQLIKDDQAKIDAINAERNAKLAELKKSTDAKSDAAIQAILEKYGVSDAQVQAKIKPYLDDIAKNKAKIAELEAADKQAEEAAKTAAAQKAQQEAAGRYTIGNASVQLPVSGTTTSLVSASNGKNSSANTLPQTGNKSNVVALALGAMTAMFGLGIVARKRQY